MEKRVIGIAGTSKNAGKTTAITAILSVLRDNNKSFCITSIGYDGEDIDNITALPKPRILIKEGEYTATAYKCLNSDNFELIENTGLFTPLGEIFIARAKKDTLVITAGPNKSSDLKKLSEKLNFEYILVDGALNRIAPMSATDGIIVSVGASKSVNINELANIAESIEGVLSIKSMAIKYEKLLSNNITLFDDDFNILIDTGYSSLLVENNINSIDDNKLSKAKYLYIPGVINFNIISKLLEKKYRKNELTLVLNNPIQLLSGAYSIDIYKTVNKLKLAGINIRTLKNIALLAITVNPFYPKYDFKSNTYSNAFIDEKLLFDTVKEHVKCPVFDVVKYNSKSIESLFI